MHEQKIGFGENTFNFTAVFTNNNNKTIKSLTFSGTTTIMLCKDFKNIIVSSLIERQNESRKITTFDVYTI